MRTASAICSARSRKPCGNEINCRRSPRGPSASCSCRESCSRRTAKKSPRAIRFTLGATPFTLGALRFTFPSRFFSTPPSIVGKASNECETSERRQLSRSTWRIVDVPIRSDDATKFSLRLSNPSLGTCRYTRVVCEMDALRISTRVSARASYRQQPSWRNG